MHVLNAGRPGARSGRGRRNVDGFRGREPIRSFIGCASFDVAATSRTGDPQSRTRSSNTDEVGTIGTPANDLFQATHHARARTRARSVFGARIGNANRRPRFRFTRRDIFILFLERHRKRGQANRCERSLLCDTVAHLLTAQEHQSPAERSVGGRLVVRRLRRLCR